MTKQPHWSDTPGAHRVRGPLKGGKHVDDGKSADVSMGDGAIMTIVNPQSFEDGGPEWIMRYGDPVSIRYTVASLLESYDYLLCGEITAAEAARRLWLMRKARAALIDQQTPSTEKT